MSSKKSPIGFTGLVEDVLGLNIRGLVTIRDAFVRPRKVGRAAHSFDWESTYTPSIRVVYFLLTLSSLLSFIWTAEDGALAQTVLAQLERASDEDTLSLTREEQREAVNRYLALNVAVVPFSYTVGQVLAAFFSRVWGRGIGFVLRLRLHFAAIIPSTVIGVASVAIFASPWVVENLGFLAISGLTAILLLAVDAITAGRMVPATTRRGRLGRALLFGATSQAFGIASSLAASIIASLIAL